MVSRTARVSLAHSLRTVRPHDLNAEVYGPDDGPSLLFLHGWGSSIDSMRPLAQGLSDAYRGHVLDLPGHGASPSPPEPWGVPEHANLLRSYLNEIVQGPATLVGHSNGGRIALYMASTPEMADVVTRLVLISPSGIEPKRSWSQVLRSRLASVLKAPVQALPAPLQAPAADWLRHSLVWRLLGSTDYNALSGVMRETFVKTVNFHLDGDLRRVQVPTLLFWGTEDEAVSRRQVERIEAEIDDCGLVELDGAGHYGHLDDIDTVRGGIQYFLEHTSPAHA